MVSSSGASPAVVATRTAALVAGLVTKVGGVAFAPRSVGTIATTSEFAAVKYVDLTVRYRCPRVDVQDGIFITFVCILS